MGLLTLAVFGGVFQSDPLPFEMPDVSVVSAEEYAALTGQVQNTVSNPVGAPDVAQPPEVADPAPETPAPSRPEPTPQPEPVVRPDPAPEPEPERAPEPIVPPAPEPQAPVTVVTPPIPPQAQETPTDLTSSVRPRPRPVERIAPVPVAAPPPDAAPAPETTPAVVPDDGAASDQTPQEPTAPEEATDRTVTEADETSPEVALPPTRTVRPPSRPNRPSRPAPSNAPSNAPAAETAPDTSDAVNAALAEALGGGGASAAPSGPPLTAGEQDALRVAVAQCWNLGSSSSAALATTVVVGVRMTRDGRPETGSIRMLSYEGGDQGAAKTAYDAARRAIIRCGVDGYKLPPEKYDQWRDIEMTFNPERMRIR